MSGYFGGTRGNQYADRAKVLFLCGALSSCAVLAYLFFHFNTSQSISPTAVVIKDTPPELELVEVLVPLQAIKAGRELKPSLFILEKRPQIALDSGAIRNIEQIKGYYARTLIVPGQPLHMDYVTSVRPNSAISSSIPAGHRAVTIRVDATSGVEGWALPGSRVDVVWVSRIRDQQGVTVIVQNAKVLSSNRQALAENQPDVPVPATVTLLVTAQDAQKIQLASRVGSLSLSLRGDTDAGKADSAGSITVSDLLGNANTSKEESQLPDSQGTVMIDGKKWIVRSGGELVELDR